MPTDKTDFVLRLGERLDETSARVSRVESDVLEVKRATHVLTHTVEQLSSSVSELGTAWRSMAGVFGDYAERTDSWRETTDQRLDRLEAAAFEPTR
jgi:methyl-accepting chemotaxis protein